MLMGRPPFRGREAADILAKHINEAPVPMRDINPTIQKDFADAIMRCLKKDPQDRFPTAMELRSALESVTFFTARAEPTAGEGVSRVPGTLLALIAGAAFLLGLVVAQVIR
jgi:eukaryotic-like serine/threonine-protein kinase